MRCCVVLHCFQSPFIAPSIVLHRLSAPRPPIMRGVVEGEVWWWGEWFGEPMRMDRRHVIRPLPRKNLLGELVLTECSDEESWRGRMQRDLKDSTLVCRGTGRYGHQTWFRASV